MLSNTAKRFKPGELGENVSVLIPKVDRGKADFRNTVGVVTNVVGNGTYSLGTKYGTLKQKICLISTHT